MRFLSKIKQKIRLLRNRLPSRLPITNEEFDAFCQSILNDYEFENLEACKQAVATMFMHLDPTTISFPKKFFASSIQKARVNDMAFRVLQKMKEDLKKKQETISKDEKVGEEEKGPSPEN